MQTAGELEQRTVVGVEKQKEDHRDGHDVHIEEQDDATVVEAPLEAEAAHRVERAGHGEDGGDDQLWICVSFGIAGPEEGENQAAQHQQGTAKQRFLAQFQEAWLMDSDWKRGGDDSFSLAEAAKFVTQHPVI